MEILTRHFFLFYQTLLSNPANNGFAFCPLPHIMCQNLCLLSPSLIFLYKLQIPLSMLHRVIQLSLAMPLKTCVTDL